MIAINYTILYSIATSTYCLYALPVFDFRPYHIGADIRKGMEIPPGAEQPQFETTFILKKNGQTKEFTLENYPDSTWTFVDSKTVQTSEGYVPPIHDFSMEDMTTGDDMTDDVISSKGYTFLLVSPHLENANDSYFGNMNQLYDYAQAHKYRFYCLTASNAKAIDRWRDMTGAEYPFLFTDETTLKTIVRSNPGLLLLKDGVVIANGATTNCRSSTTSRRRSTNCPRASSQSHRWARKYACRCCGSSFRCSSCRLPTGHGHGRAASENRSRRQDRQAEVILLTKTTTPPSQTRDNIILIISKSKRK